VTKENSVQISMPLVHLKNSLATISNAFAKGNVNCKLTLLFGNFFQYSL